jgi:hypothetical protein
LSSPDHRKRVISIGSKTNTVLAIIRRGSTTRSEELSLIDLNEAADENENNKPNPWLA